MSLFHAVDYAKADELRRILSSGVNVDAKDEHGRTPLMHAALCGSGEIFNILIEYGAHIDVNDDYDLSPLMDAVAGENPEIVRLLLVRGADPNARNAGEVAALHWAVNGESVEVVRLLLEHGARVDARETHCTSGTVLHWAIGDSRPANVEIVEELLKRGADVNEPDRTLGSTVLMKAAGCGDGPLVQLLLAYGADPSLRCRYGTTALSRAMTARSPECAALIRAAIGQIQHEGKAQPL